MQGVSLRIRFTAGAPLCCGSVCACVRVHFAGLSVCLWELLSIGAATRPCGPVFSHATASQGLARPRRRAGELPVAGRGGRYGTTSLFRLTRKATTVDGNRFPLAAAAATTTRRKKTKNGARLILFLASCVGEFEAKDQSSRNDFIFPSFHRKGACDVGSVGGKVIVSQLPPRA